MSLIGIRRKYSMVDVLIYLSLAIIMLLCIFPFMYVFSISFTSPDSYVPMKFALVPEKVSLDAYSYILNSQNFLRAARNTGLVTIIGTLLNLYVTLTFAYGLTQREVPGNRIMAGIVVFSLIFSAGILPNYLLVKSLGLMNSHFALILPVLTSAWDIVVVRSFMDALPKELQESAQIDGCNEWTCFFRIILPLSKALIATFTLFFAVYYWNVYFNAMVYLSDSTKWTLQVLLKTMIIDSDAMGFSPLADETVMPQETIKMAAIIMSMLPILLVYPFLQKYFAKGVMLGSVKG